MQSYKFGDLIPVFVLFFFHPYYRRNGRLNDVTNFALDLLVDFVPDSQTDPRKLSGTHPKDLGRPHQVASEGGKELDDVADGHRRPRSTHSSVQLKIDASCATDEPRPALSFVPICSSQFDYSCSTPKETGILPRSQRKFANWMSCAVRGFACRYQPRITMVGARPIKPIQIIR